ncbi:hypothetical protein OG530_32045 [Streptomyces decoyicus]|uniref:hypothetical protein n=1 Tax=Streptomyces decoyicus TaxID=249567 RepID=UPI002E190F2D
MPGGAKPPVFPVAAIDDPALPEMPAELAAARADEIDADTVNRELSIARKAIGWWQRQGWTAAEHEPTPAPHSLTVSRQARQLRLPLDAYASTVAETHLVEDAQDILMRRCMKDRGMEWKTLPLVDAQDTQPPNFRRYGADEAEALRTGYHPSPDPPSVIRRSRAWDEREALPAEMRRAAYGPSGQGGCFKTADRQLAGDTAPPGFHAFNQLTGTALETSRAPPEVRDALHRWQTCMAKAGFDYPTPTRPPATSAGRRLNHLGRTRYRPSRRGLPEVHEAGGGMGGGRDPHPAPPDPAERRPPARSQGPLAGSRPPRPETRGPHKPPAPPADQ